MSQISEGVVAPKITYRAPAGVSARQILLTTANKHRVSVDTLLSRQRTSAVVEARMEAISTMKEAGVPVSIMARVCNRERTTILYFCNPEIRRRKRERNKRIRDEARASQ